MSRITKWKLEKTKVKVVFRLQFHATHIPQTGWDKLYISFIPADSGKATSKTTKANVRNGTCKWADPIYETTRLLQDINTKQYDERLYKLVVTMGSSRSSVLGEANINLAHYSDAQKPSVVALPLQGCDSGTILHVTVQLLTSKTGFREFEQQRELRERGLQSTSDESAARKISSSEDAIIDHMDKVNARIKFKEELPPLEEVGLNEEYAGSAAGFDGSSNTSESLYAEKHDTSSSHEVESLKSTISGDLAALSLGQSSLQEKGDPSDHRFLPQGTNDWAHSWASDYSADNDLKNSYEENSRLRGSLEAAQSSIVDLKLEVSSLQSHAEEIGIEAQKFSHLLADEIASGEQLAKEVSVLKKECLKFKDDLEQLKISKISTSFAIRETMKTDQDHFFQEIQLRWLKGLLDMEDKIRALNSKACFGFHETDFRSFNTDLEALLCTLQDLKQGTGQQISGLNLESVTETREMTLHKGDQLLAGTRFDADFYLAEGTLHCANIPALVSQEFDSTDANNAMKGKILELIRELNELKAERDGLSRKMDQMECYYEALVQELEENQRQMMGELQNLRNEHSTCLYTISATKDEMETITQDMNKQIIKFSEEKQDLDSLNKDLERRAATAEAALKRARLNYSIAVDQLQKDLEVLSFQVLSMYETNENLIKKAFTESSVPSFLGYEKRVQTQKLDSKEHHAARILQCQNQHDGSKKQNLDGDIVSEELNRSLLLQKGLYKKVEEEVYEVHLVNVYLDVFSKTLQETLLEISTEFNLMKEKVNNLTQQLGLSAESKELLILKLQAATDEVYNLKDYKDTCDAKCNNLALHNQVLEKQIQNVTHENCLLSQKTTEMEVLIKELASYESKYATCSEEKLELENLLKKEMLENGNLQSEVSSLQEEMKALRTEFDELASLKENLQNAVNVLPHKLQNMLASYDKKCNGLPFWSEHICQGIESKDIVDITLQIEEIQRSACEKIVQLIQEKKDLVHERDSAQVSLNVAQSDNLVMKEKFKHDIVNIMGKMNVSSDLVQKLQSEVEAVANRLKISFEAEENYAQQHRELFSDFDHLKVELDQLAFRNNDLAQEIIALESVSEEVGRCKLEVAALSQEKEALMTTLKDKTEESANLSLELCSLKSSLQSFYDDLHVERSIRDMAQLSLNAVQSDKLVMKQKFEHDLRNIVGKMDVSNVLVQKLQAEVEAINNRLKISFEAEENYAQKHRELLSDFERLEVELQQLSENKDLAQEIMALENVTEELERCKLEKAMFSEEKEALMMTLKDKTEESAKLTLELNGLKSSFQSLRDEFKVDRSIRDTLESIVADLTSKLNEKQYELLQFDRLKTELVHLKQFVSDLELEKSRLCCILLDNEERLKVARKECSSNYCLEMQLNSMFEFLIASDVKVAFTKTQYEVWNQELMQQLYSKDCYLAEFQKKYVNVESMLNSCLASEANHIEESTKLMTSLNSIKSELDASIAQNRVLLDANSTLRTELEECKQRAESRDTMFHVDTSKNAFEVEKLEHRLVKSEEEIDNLMFSKEELEVKNLVLKAKLDEQQPQIAMLEEYKNELTTLQNKYNELAHRLSEQVLKTEEFKNLSIHLKELKDKADAECIQVCEKREPEGPPLAMQESLRIAFIKEQYETRLQELKHQLSVSKKHSEEMLWKLQDAIDEVENKKKSEASYLKRNGELGMRILELETELQSAISEKREMMKVYDLMKAEKECSSISLECCKEEKLQLEASLQKCNEEKSKISIELTSMKDLLESSANVLNSLKEENDVLHRADSMSNEPANKMFYQKNLISVSPSNGKLRTKMLPANGSMNDPLDKLSDQDISQEVKQACLVPINEADHSNAVVNIGAEQDALMSRDVNGVSSLVHVSQDDVLQSETKRLALVNKHFKAQSLKSSMDHLHRELERMKYENLILTQDDNQFDPDCPALQKELMKLHKVNEELGSIFPLFNEFSSSGNALERVLALEIELAESLQAKKKSSIHFQSSFLKQHSDEEAVFQSFRDINELIEDMLELKGRYAAVETELKDMHDRYSQLSLQFAEVEGERQKLMMTLKNVRASKKAPQMSRSSTVPFGDHLS